MNTGVTKLLAIFVSLGILFTVAVFVTNNYFPVTESQRLSKQCQDFGKQYLEDNAELYTEQDEHRYFFSKRLDTCVKVTINELQNEYSIMDIQQKYLKDLKSLFWCDRDGVNNTILAKAEFYNGSLYSVSFENFLDDGKGGPAGSIKTPDKPYTRDECRAALSVKLEEIR